MFGRRKSFSRDIRNANIDPDEVLLDAFNLPSFDTNQFEGRVERAIGGRVSAFVGIVFMIVFTGFLFQAWNLQVARGEALALLSQQNRLDKEVLFAERGVIYDRLGQELAWNVAPSDSLEEQADGKTFSLRAYTSQHGLGHLLGFIGYPEKDSSGFWWRTNYVGKTGIEATFNDVLEGENGNRIIEVDALDNVQSQNIIRDPVDGENVTLSIDADVQEAMFRAIRDGVETAGFIAGAGVVMDVETGEIIAITNYPEFSSQVMTDGVDEKVIQGYAQAKAQPFLNRAVSGLYTPGSIVKPFIASAALSEKIIDPATRILSTGQLVVPNKYNPDLPSIFRDWKAHGWVNMREAIAVSSDVYFYEVGGGFETQRGLGIERIDDYMKRFGFGQAPGSIFPNEAEGVIPTPEWKAHEFNNDPWRVGDTYITAIGQYGFQVSPLQVVRAVASLANGGTLLTPVIEVGAGREGTSVGVDDAYLQVAREGMELAVDDPVEGTAKAIKVSGISLAGKTGTAQLGYHNEWMNSWVVGFWPAENPKFAFAVVLEKAPAHTLRGAAPSMRSFFEWLVRERPEYAKGEYPTEPIKK